MVWGRATAKDSDTFWTDQFEKLATRVLLHLAKLNEVVDGDAPVTTSAPPKPEAAMANPASETHRRAEQERPPRPPTPVREQRERKRVVSDEYYYSVNEKAKGDLP